MSSVFAFFITLFQLSLLVFAYFQQGESEQWQQLFTLITAHFSPVMIFFFFIQAGVGFGGAYSYWAWFGLVYCLIKYFILWRALKTNDINALSVSALFMEIAYLAGSTYVIIYYNYL